MATKLETLKEHCARLERRLPGCAGADEARALKQQICDALGQRCRDPLVRSLLDEHAEQLIAKRFDGAPPAAG